MHHLYSFHEQLNVSTVLIFGTNALKINKYTAVAIPSLLIRASHTCHQRSVSALVNMSTLVIMSKFTCCTTTRRISKVQRSSVRVQAHQVSLQNPQGAEHVCQMNNTQSLLDAALAAGVDVPHLCRTGTCGVCAAASLEGSVHREDFLLDDAQSEMGSR